MCAIGAEDPRPRAAPLDSRSPGPRVRGPHDESASGPMGKMHYIRTGAARRILPGNGVAVGLLLTLPALQQPFQVALERMLGFFR